MGVWPRFIFALMRLCSAAYWCFCHIVKIYAAVSLPGNGLLLTPGPEIYGPIWPTEEKGGKTEQEAAEPVSLR